MTSPDAWADPRGLLGVLNRCSGPTVTSVTPCITHVEQIPWRPGRPTAWPTWVTPAIRSCFQAKGIERPWSHQAQAAELAHAGHDVVVATGTASGKSLAYQLPALTALMSNPKACVLYLAPTKALAADQLESLESLGLPGLRAGSYDGDSDMTERDWTRSHANWILTNPDMLHRGVLPAHARWARMLRRLKYVVVDECHAYRGVFGSHVALVLRRLIRLATMYGAEPVFIFASATSADPPGSTAKLIGRRVLAVDWGEWAWNAWEDGLAGYAEELQEFFRANRARIGIDFEQGWQSLLRALATGESRVVVNSQDFGLMVRYSSKFTIAAVSSPGSADTEDRHPRPELVTPYQEPAGAVELAIAEIWCDALRLERLGVLDNFFELGGNSLLGVNIVAALRREFAPVELPPHVLYEAPTVAALGAVIEAQLSGTAGAGQDDGADSQVRAQLRRSGLQASATRRRGR